MSKTLVELSNGLADVVAAAQKAVVRVDGRRRLPASGFVWSADGWIITASHVLRRDENIRVSLHEGESVQVALVGRDPQRDLALLKADSGALTEIPFGSVGDARVGHLVLALGRPGSGIMATMGVISAVGPERESGDETMAGQYLQTDVVMYPGFSGGPLVSASGTILGLNTSGLMRGASFTVPVERIARSVGALIEHGRIRQGYLGLSLQPVRISGRQAEDLDQETGLMVVAVEQGGPAEEAGVLQGDVLVKFGSSALASLDQLFLTLSDDRIGESLPLNVLRAGAFTELQVTIGERGG